MNELWPKEQIKELLKKRHYKNRINFEAMGIKQSGIFCLKTDITLGSYSSLLFMGQNRSSNNFLSF